VWGASAAKLGVRVEAQRGDELADGADPRPHGALHQHASPGLGEGDVAVRDERLAVAQALPQLPADLALDGGVPAVVHLGEHGRREHGAEARAEAVLVRADAVSIGGALLLQAMSSLVTSTTCS
jgi:hypothetical protein